MHGFLVSTFIVLVWYYFSCFGNYYGRFVATDIWRCNEKCNAQICLNNIELKTFILNKMLDFSIRFLKNKIFEM